MNLIEWFRPYWTPINFFYYALISNILISLWDLYLHYRQHRIYKSQPKLPIDLAPYMDEESFNKARLYNLDKSNFGIIHEVFNIFMKMFLLWILFSSILWTVSTEITYKYFQYHNEIFSTIVFFILQSSISTMIDLPFSLYSNFVIEERHGFNKYTLKFFIWDMVKKFLVFQPIVSLLVGGATYIIIRFEDQFFFYLWLFSTLTAFIFLIIYPSLIAPLFDTYTPLEDSSLKTEIQRLAEKIKFPLKNIYVVDGSKRSNHSNAYFYGFFKSKQIVIYDTLFDENSIYRKKIETEEEKEAAAAEKDISESLEGDEKERIIKEKTKAEEKPKKKSSGCSEKEIVAIICHELGHWYHSHVFKNLIVSLVNLFLIFKIASLFYNDNVIYEAFGFFGVNKPKFIGLTIVIETIFLLYFEVITFCLTPLDYRDFILSFSRSVLFKILGFQFCHDNH
ncbi:CAAX prenyl protease 1 -like protein [Sarcoptes scabiei]|uniref:CAAX prenyl protease n=1 Tax=Sarcoptes scabiei TaxID=52283 RepID=A0A834R7B3_SARSC|nr:CAAX prenyl protease 1 -like protein [Sarcoptes scabiei]